MLRTGGGCSVYKPESSFERFERVAGEVAGRFPRFFSFVDSEVLFLSWSPRFVLDPLWAAISPGREGVELQQSISCSRSWRRRSRKTK